MPHCVHPMVNVTDGKNVCFTCKEYVPMCIHCDGMEWQHTRSSNHKFEPKEVPV